MESYSQYKDSCIPWYGSIPHHWRIAQIRRLFEISRGRVISGLEMNPLGAKYPVFSSQTVNSGIMGYLPTYDFDVPQLTWTTDGANAGTVFLRTGKYSCTNICGILKPLRKALVDLRYFHYCLGYTCEFHKRRDTNGYKIMSNEMASISVVLPPLEEQISIGTYLDHRTEEIDGVVGKLQRQRELLERYKRELIAHTVIRGLNPDAPMQDSGIDWIGSVPASWRIAPAKALFSKRSENEKTDDVHLTPSQKFGVLPQEKYIEISGSKPMLKLSSAGSMRHVEPGDFIIHLRSFQGGLELSSFAGKVSAAYTVVTPRHPRYQRYFRWLLKSTPYISKLASLTNQLRDGQNIAYGTFTLMRLPSPPIAIQTEIADYLDSKTAEIDGLIADLDRQVELLGTYRKQLIHDVVTGKVRVCEESA